MIIKSVLSVLNNRSDHFNLLKRFKTVNNKRINEMNIYFNRFNRFNI